MPIKNRRAHFRKVCDFPAILQTVDESLSLEGLAADLSNGGFRFICRPWRLDSSQELPWLDEFFGQPLTLCVRGDGCLSWASATVVSCWRLGHECGLRIVACLPLARKRIESALSVVDATVDLPGGREDMGEKRGPWNYDCFSKEPAAVAWRKRLEYYAANRRSLYTLWPGHDEWTFNNWSLAIAKALSESKRSGSYVPVWQLNSEYPELVAIKLCVATPKGRIERQ